MRARGFIITSVGFGVGDVQEKELEEAISAQINKGRAS